MDLIYMNSSMQDIGVIKAYNFDLAFGSDENNFELKVGVNDHCCEAGYYVYIEGTEYGGIIDAVASDTAAEEVTYTGRTWHGILNSKVLCPDSGQDYLTLNGNANTVLGTLISRMGLTSIFAASSDASNLTLSSYKMERYITGYDGIRKMLKTVNGKLVMSYNGTKVILSAVPIVDYTDAGVIDSDIMSFSAKKTSRKVNHLICLGQGELKDRTVVHLYADTSGSISQTQTLTGLDEYSTVYDYSSAKTTEDLIKAGSEQLAELQKQDDLSVSLSESEDVFDVGDIVGAVDNVTGIAISVPISKKIISIQNDYLSAAYETEIGKANVSTSSGEKGESAATDYIVEQGATTNWYYRKWNSGVAECWRTLSIPGYSCNTAVGSWYSTALLTSAPYPFTFTETPNLQMFFETDTGTGGIVWPAGTDADDDPKTRPHKFYIIRMTSLDSISGKIHFQVKGKWK